MSLEVDTNKRDFIKKASLAGFAGVLAISEAKNAFAKTIVNSSGVSTDDVINVKVYGAIGDGSHDDTAAIQNAANCLTNGGALYFPPGTYLISQTITIVPEAVIVRGSNSLTTVIKASNSFSGTEVLKFDHATGFNSDRSVSVYELYIDCNNKNASGLVLLKPYDGIVLQNIYVNNVADSCSAYKIIPDPDNTQDKVSQTIFMVNCIGQHKNATATGPVFYFDTVQEMTLIGCKAFCGVTYPSTVQGPNNGFHFKDCRGVNVIGCSVATTSLYPFYIETASRVSMGFSFIGTTFESVNKIMKVVGSATYPVSEVYLNFSRNESSGTSAPEFDFTYLSNSQVDMMGFNGVFANCSYNVIMNNTDFQATPSQKSWICDGVEQLRMTHPWTQNNTSLMINVNKAGTVSFSQVSIGAANSGGSGYRTLLIPN